MATRCLCSWERVEFGEGLSIVLRGETHKECALHFSQDMEEAIRRMEAL